MPLRCLAKLNQNIFPRGDLEFRLFPLMNNQLRPITAGSERLFALSETTVWRFWGGLRFATTCLGRMRLPDEAPEGRPIRASLQMAAKPLLFSAMRHGSGSEARFLAEELLPPLGQQVKSTVLQ